MEGILTDFFSCMFQVSTNQELIGEVNTSCMFQVLTNQKLIGEVNTTNWSEPQLTG
jgi:hypothetical protein